VELYQTLLQEAIIMARAAQKEEGEDLEEALDLHEWTPQINVGTAVLIPETYIPDLGLRLSFYRRIGNLRNANEIEMISQEMVDRFGHLPLEVRNLFDVVQLKLLCWACGISNVDAGPKGLVIGFYNNQFSNPQALLKYLQKPETNKEGFVKIRPDQKIAFARDWANPKARLLGTRKLMMEISQL
jgi:transcription-repair coupling factor (superfamily II helicase)